MSANKICKIEQEPKHQYSLDELKSIIKQAMAEHREFVEREIKPQDDERECYLTTWDDVLSYVQRLDLDPKPQFPDNSELLWEVLDDMEIASMLVRSGTRLHVRQLGDESESSFLHVLSSSDDPRKHELAVLMIEHGADVNDCDAEGKTALHLAVMNEAFDVIEAMLKETKYPHFLSREYKVSVALAMRSPNVTKLLRLFSQHCDLDIMFCFQFLSWDMSDDDIARVVQMLLQLARQKNEPTFDDILQYALSNNVKLAKLLFSCIDEKVKFDILQRQLSHGYILNKLDWVVLLIKEGADINDYVDEDRQYPLHVACRTGLTEAVQLLLRLGADVNVVDLCGETPFAAIAEFGIDDTIRLMIKHFGYLTSADKKINKNDLLIIQSNPDSRNIYKSIIEELDNIKTIEATDSFPYYNFFSKTIYELSLIMRNSNMFFQLRKSFKLLKPEIFPFFKDDMITKFEIAKKMKNTVISREQELEEAFSGILPCIVARKIAKYSLDLINFEREYHMSCFSTI